MAQLSSKLSRAQFGSHSAAKFPEVGRGDWNYDRHCSRCFVLQELFDTFDNNSYLDILNSANENCERDSHLDEIWRCLDSTCGGIFQSFLSCFAVQVSITLFHITYSWMQQLFLVLNDLFLSETSDQQWTKRTDFVVVEVEVV